MWTTTIPKPELEPRIAALKEQLIHGSSFTTECGTEAVTLDRALEAIQEARCITLEYALELQVFYGNKTEPDKGLTVPDVHLPH